MSRVLDDYFDALERLKRQQPMIVPKGTKITKDSVAMEAGRGKGSIKRSRPMFSDLIAAIQEAAGERTAVADQLSVRLTKEKERGKEFRRLYEESLARELSLIHENDRLKAEIKKLRKSPSSIRRVK